MLNSRIWPHGEFSIWEEKKSLDISDAPPDDPLGLSLLPISHKIQIGLADEPAPRAKRGSRGITRYGQRVVKSGAYLLQEKAGADCLSFLTCTLPAISESDQYLCGIEWAEITRQYVQQLRRYLTKRGLPGSIVGCTEIQGQRYARDGGLPLHLHLVFEGRRRGGPWALTVAESTELWRRAVEARVPSVAGASWRAAVNLERVRESVSGYLGKYLSKGERALAAVIKDDAAIVEFLPSSWWFCSDRLRKAVLRRVTGGNATARLLLQDCRDKDTRVQYSALVELTFEDGGRVAVAIVGTLSPEGRRRYCKTVV